eukprot:Phypoly_transcript_06460.p1 GENE.Phypoly_transcript_06460~~Phypoly_transcript_06460.p1  ORF type:complete len:279 (+),score=52.69 Phypoly_transcript_06460:613-1449(+)
MTTEYYQIPSQQGLLPLDSTSPDPWLASATSSFSTLSLADWGVKVAAKPSLFEPGTADALSWKHVVPMHTAGTKVEVKAPKVPKQFHATTSKIDAWSVVDTSVVSKQQPTKRNTKTQPSSPSVPAEDKPIEDELSVQNRYKTELCKSFTETGTCRYGVKCQFAHGKEEIRSILRHPKYKTEICKTFHTSGTCPYGIRCRFIHTRSKEESLSVQKVAPPSLPVELEEEDVDDDDIVSLNHPPGIPVPQWSKSWNMSLATAMPRKTSRVSDRLVEPEPAF